MVAKDLCKDHYDRNYKYGDPLYIPPKKGAVTKDVLGIEGKTCTKCLTWRPLGMFYANTWSCKICFLGLTEEEFFLKQEKREYEEYLLARGWLICIDCGEAKPVDAFYNNSSAPSKRVGKRADCKECSQKRTQQWDLDNPERAKAQWVLYYAENSEKHLARNKIYNIKKPHVKRQASRRRRSLLQNAISEKYSDPDIADHCGWICGICGKPIDPDLKWPDLMSFQIDHVWPISKGGPDIRINVRPSHQTCNASKHNRMPTVNGIIWFMILLTAAHISGMIPTTEDNDAEVIDDE